MTIEEHAESTFRSHGIRAEDIHKWIDGLFDAEGFARFLRSETENEFNPYDHRIFRHCREALEDAYKEFEGMYSKEQIKQVFETHLRDDYGGYIPARDDFYNGTFKDKYHENTMLQNSDRILSDQELNEYFAGKSYDIYSRSRREYSKRFLFRIALPSIVAMVLFVVSIFSIILPIFEKKILEDKREMIRELIHTAVNAIEYYVELEQNGVLDRETAQGRAAEEIRRMRYGESGKDYFWITDTRPNMIMHPYRPELEGRNLTDYKDREDKSGKNIFVEFVRIVESQGAGYLEYLWQWMDDPDTAALKLSFVQGIEQWNWIVGTGVYITDIRQETTRLSRNLLILDGGISLIMIALLLNVVLQSRKIEDHRLRAETGLREAKDRYRALVEVSNEGYILELDGKVAYSNRILQKYLDYSEEELTKIDIVSLLDPEVPENDHVREHLKTLFFGDTAPGKFEAVVLTSRKRKLEVILTTSKIFFSQKHGHVISFRPIRYTVDFGGTVADAAPFFPEVQEVARDIRTSHTMGHVIETLNLLPVRIKNMVDAGSSAERLRSSIGIAYEAAIVRCIELTLEEIGPPPVAFAFLSLGSNGRREMTVFSDQDNALVFENVPEESLLRARKYFLALAESVSGKLNDAGYRYCTGGIMASNPRWCLSLREWQEQFTRWITQPQPEALLSMNVFSDLHCTFGSPDLADAVRDGIITEIKRTPVFLGQFARHAVGYRLARDILGRVKATLNLKECLKPLEVCVRAYALKYAVKEPGTLQRLTQLSKLGVFDRESRGEFEFVFNYLWDLRFKHQIHNYIDLRRVNDELTLSHLLPLERKNLQNVLGRIDTFLSKLSNDFLGNPLL